MRAGVEASVKEYRSDHGFDAIIIVVEYRSKEASEYEWRYSQAFGLERLKGEQG
jgi:hypothetical protein